MTRPKGSPRARPPGSVAVAPATAEAEAEVAMATLELQVRELTLRSAVHTLRDDPVPRSLRDFVG